MGKLFLIAIGAGLMYFMDPEHGSERQSTWKEKMDKWMNKSGDMFGTSSSSDFGSQSSYGSTYNSTTTPHTSTTDTFNTTKAA